MKTSLHQLFYICTSLLFSVRVECVKKCELKKNDFVKIFDKDRKLSSRSTLNWLCVVQVTVGDHASVHSLVFRIRSFIFPLPWLFISPFWHLFSLPSSHFFSLEFSIHRQIFCLVMTCQRILIDVSMGSLKTGQNCWRSQIIINQSTTR